MKTSPVRSETVKKILRPALIVLAVLIVLLNSITIVQAGHTGVVVRRVCWPKASTSRRRSCRRS